MVTGMKATRPGEAAISAPVAAAATAEPSADAPIKGKARNTHETLATTADGWPSYAHALEIAPAKSSKGEGRPRRQVSAARRGEPDFIWCMAAIWEGFKVEEIAERLMQESAKAQQYGRRYAKTTAYNAKIHAVPRERREPSEEFERYRAAQGRQGKWTWEDHFDYEQIYLAAENAVWRSVMVYRGKIWCVRSKMKRRKQKRHLLKVKRPGHTGETPSSETAVTPQLRMVDDFNIAVKQTRTEVLGRLVDLGNSALAPDERLRRARRLVASYQRRRAENLNYPASPEVLAAFSIINKENYKRRKAKAEGKAKLAM